MHNQKDFYVILGVSRYATTVEIKIAYLMLAKEWHPDKHQNADEARRKTAEEKFKDLVEAYSVLSDAAKRADYDLTLRDQEPEEPDFYGQYARQPGRETREDPIIANETLKKAFLDKLAFERQNAGQKYAIYAEIFRGVYKGVYNETRYREDIKLANADALTCADAIRFIIEDAKKKRIRFIVDELNAADNLEREIRDLVREASSVTFREAVLRMKAQGEHGLVVHSTDLYKLVKSDSDFWKPHNAWLRLKLYEQINLGINEYNNRKIMECFLDNEDDKRCIETFKRRVLDNVDMFTINEMKVFYRKTGFGEKSRADILRECNITPKEVLKHRSLRVIIDNTPILELTMSAKKAEQQRKDARALYEKLVMKSSLIGELKKPFSFNFGDTSENSTDWRKRQTPSRG
jgi:curved DNA-binding protein CbpA